MANPRHWQALSRLPRWARFNVAASRARDQMWIVHSLSPHNDLKAEGLRRQLIEHAQDPSRLMRAGGKGKAHAVAVRTRSHETPFGRRLSRHSRSGKSALSASISSSKETANGWPSSATGIAIIGSKNSRKTWIASPFSSAWAGFSRASAARNFCAIPSALKPVVEKLQLLEISPETAKPDSARKGTPSHGLVDRVVSHAEELRAAWSAPQEPSAARQREPRHVFRNEYSAN